MALFGGGDQELNITIKARDEASAKLDTLGGSIKKLALGFGAGMIGVQALEKGLGFLAEQVSSTIAAFADSEKVTAQTNAVLESTGFAAGYTATQIQAMATALEGQTTFSDEAVKSAENLLLTFTNIGHDVFPQATQTVLDMSVALGQDAKSSAIQLGKALQDPIEGTNALRRVGVNFSDAQQEVIKKMVESGQTMEAQRYILKELATEFGGSATGQAKTFAGQVEQMKNRIDDAKEEIGHGLTPILGNLISTLGDTMAHMMGTANTAELVFESFRGVVEVTALVTTKVLELGGAAVKTASFLANLVDIRTIWDKGLDASYKKQADNATAFIGGTENAFQGLIEKNIASAASFKTMEADSAKALAGMRSASSTTASQAGEDAKKISDKYGSLRDAVQKTVQTSVDELARLKEAHNSSIEASEGRISDLRKSLSDLADSYTRTASAAAAAFAKQNTSDRTGVAEQIVAQEQKIKDLNNQAGLELNPEKKLMIQDQLKKEQDAYAANADFIKSMQAEVDTARIRASETDFQRAIDDFNAKRIQAQADYDAQRAEAAAEYAAKKKELRAQLVVEQEKMDAEVEKYHTTREQIKTLIADASKSMLDTTQKTTAGVLAAVDSEIDRYNRLAEAIQRASQGKPSVVSTASKISAHEFGGTVPGPRGMPVPIIAHGQEQVIPAGGSSKSGGGAVSIVINNPVVRNDTDISVIRAQMEEAWRDITRGHKLTTI